MASANGMVKGPVNALTMLEIVPTIIKRFVLLLCEVDGHSYVGVPDGQRRHNIAQVHAGFCDYDWDTFEGLKRQRVPVILFAKCGRPLKAKDPNPVITGSQPSLGWSRANDDIRILNHQLGLEVQWDQSGSSRSHTVR